MPVGSGAVVLLFVDCYCHYEIPYLFYGCALLDLDIDCFA